MFTQILKGEKVSKERALQILARNFEKKNVLTRPYIIIFFMNGSFGSSDTLFTNIVKENVLSFSNILSVYLNCT